MVVYTLFHCINNMYATTMLYAKEGEHRRLTALYTQCGLHTNGMASTLEHVSQVHICIADRHDPAHCMQLLFDIAERNLVSQKAKGCTWRIHKEASNQLVDSIQNC